MAVVCDQGIVAERAWAIPYLLRERLGHLDPARMAAAPAEVAHAFQTPPKLHRFVNDIAAYVSGTAKIVVERYGGDAARLWSDVPSAAELRHRLEQFPGIGQKKATMAVELLERDLKVPLAELSGSDVAYDVHVRRVLLRSGLRITTTWITWSTWPGDFILSDPVRSTIRPGGSVARGAGPPTRTASTAASAPCVPSSSTGRVGYEAHNRACSAVNHVRRDSQSPRGVAGGPREELPFAGIMPVGSARALTGIPLRPRRLAAVCSDRRWQAEELRSLTQAKRAG